MEDRLVTGMSRALQKICLVRHGETAWTISGQYTGRTDIELTERGERDAQQLSARLRVPMKSDPFDVVAAIDLSLWSQA